MQEGESARERHTVDEAPMGPYTIRFGESAPPPRRGNPVAVLINHFPASFAHARTHFVSVTALEMHSIPLGIKELRGIFYMPKRTFHLELLSFIYTYIRYIKFYHRVSAAQALAHFVYIRRVLDRARSVTNIGTPPLSRGDEATEELYCPVCQMDASTPTGSVAKNI